MSDYTTGNLGTDDNKIDSLIDFLRFLRKTNIAPIGSIQLWTEITGDSTTRTGTMLYYTLRD